MSHDPSQNPAPPTPEGSRKVGDAKPSHRDDALIAAALGQIPGGGPARGAGLHGLAGGNPPGFAAATRKVPVTPSSLDIDARTVPIATHGPLRSDSLAGYELLEEKFRGGQGSVYEALQKATKRKVAIKVLYDGPNVSDNARRRFEREVEILSQLRHPNIVVVHDSGEADGRFYYVMDLVQGQSLDRWCEAQRKRCFLPDERGRVVAFRAFIEEMLRLFAKICDAVNAAHLRGVIHRDLKPGNILIDGSGAPHLLDFGLAKFTFGMPDDPSHVPSMTRTGQFVGSLPWSSPEQAGDDGDELDMRTDVYSLGVLLYQALTGQFPYRVVGGLVDVIEQIRTAPPRPMNDSLARTEDSLRKKGAVRAVARRRPIDAELDTIVSSCLHKDCNRRYQSAGDIADDLRRYLTGEPIQARRDSIMYVLHKRLKKNAWAVAAGASVVSAIICGFIVSLHFWQRAERESEFARRSEYAAQQDRDRARTAEKDARAERDRAIAAEQAARARLTEAESVTTLLEEMFGSANVETFPGRDVTIRQMLDHHSEALFKRLEDQPAVQQRMHATVGNAWRIMGDFDKSREHLESALRIARQRAVDDPARLCHALNNLGGLELALGRFAEAVTAHEEALMVARERGGQLELELDSALRLANVHEAQADVEKAEPLLRDVLERLDDSTQNMRVGRAQALRQLAACADHRGQAEEAESLYLAALTAAEREPVAARNHIIGICNDYALLLYRQKRLDEALALQQQALEAMIAITGSDSADSATCRNNLALTLLEMGKPAEAEPLFAAAMQARQNLLPPDHPELASSYNNLAGVCERMGALSDADTYYCQALEIMAARFPPEHPIVMLLHGNLARTRLAAGDWLGAEAVLEPLVAARRVALNRSPAALSLALGQLGQARLQLGSTSGAEACLSEGIEIRRSAIPDGDAETRKMEALLLECRKPH